MNIHLEKALNLYSEFFFDVDCAEELFHSLVQAGFTKQGLNQEQNVERMVEVYKEFSDSYEDITELIADLVEDGFVFEGEMK